TRGSRSARAAYRAAVRPAGPDPMMISFSCDISLSRPLKPHEPAHDQDDATEDCKRTRGGKRDLQGPEQGPQKEYHRGEPQSGHQDSQTTESYPPGDPVDGQ